MPISSRFKQIFEGRILKELTIQASKIAEKAKTNANWSKSIPDAIEVGKAQKTSTGYEVDVTIDLNKAPEAAAFEYGSGEHGEEGKTYTIPGMPFLAIPRERWPKFEPPPDVDPVVLGSVEHPGVEARPYLQPAIESTRAGFVSSIAKIFKRSYLDGTVKVTVISAKK